MRRYLGFTRAFWVTAAIATAAGALAVLLTGELLAVTAYWAFAIGVVGTMDLRQPYPDDIGDDDDDQLRPA